MSVRIFVPVETAVGLIGLVDDKGVETDKFGERGKICEKLSSWVKCWQNTMKVKVPPNREVCTYRNYVT